jgi:hypothetical protein
MAHLTCRTLQKLKKAVPPSWQYKRSSASASPMIDGGSKWPIDHAGVLTFDLATDGRE